MIPLSGMCTTRSRSSLERPIERCSAIRSSKSAVTRRSIPSDNRTRLVDDRLDDTVTDEGNHAEAIPTTIGDVLLEQQYDNCWRWTFRLSISRAWES